MSDYRNEFLSQLSPYNSHVNYETWLENQLTQTKKELEELQDAVREWDERPTGLRRACIRTAIEASRQRNTPKEI